MDYPVKTLKIVLVPVVSDNYSERTLVAEDIIIDENNVLRIQSRGGLVKQNDSGGSPHCASNTDSLLLTAGDVVSKVTERLIAYTFSQSR